MRADKTLSALPLLTTVIMLAISLYSVATTSAQGSVIPPWKEDLLVASLSYVDVTGHRPYIYQPVGDDECIEYLNAHPTTIPPLGESTIYFKGTCPGSYSFRLTPNIGTITVTTAFVEDKPMEAIYTAPTREEMGTYEQVTITLVPPSGSEKSVTIFLSTPEEAENTLTIHLEINPDPPGAGQTVTIDGYVNFKEEFISGADVNIRITGSQPRFTQSGTVKTDGNGYFKVRYTIAPGDEDPYGKYTITVNANKEYKRGQTQRSFTVGIDKLKVSVDPRVSYKGGETVREGDKVFRYPKYLVFSGSVVTGREELLEYVIGADVKIEVSPSGKLGGPWTTLSTGGPNPYKIEVPLGRESLGEYTVTVTASKKGFAEGAVQKSFTIETSPFTLGDLNGNGRLDSGDATEVLRRVRGGGRDLKGEYALQADMNGNGILDEEDARILLGKVVGLK